MNKKEQKKFKKLPIKRQKEIIKNIKYIIKNGGVIAYISQDTKVTSLIQHNVSSYIVGGLISAMGKVYKEQMLEMLGIKEGTGLGGKLGQAISEAFLGTGICPPNQESKKVKNSKIMSANKSKKKNLMKKRSDPTDQEMVQKKNPIYGQV